MKAFLILLSLLTWSTVTKAGIKTNFIQILTDDQGWGDLGSYGHKWIESPHLDKLSKEGLNLRQCYSAAAVCSPSRAAILTGRTPYRNGVYHWIHTNHALHLKASEITLPQLLRKGGYQTAHFGKWHLSHYSEDRKARTYEFGGKGQPSMDDYGYDYSFVTGNVARPSHKNPENFFENGKPVGLIEGFSAQIVAQYFERWVKSKRDKNKPFFITIWLHEPHGPISSNPSFMKPYDQYTKDTNLKQYLGNITQLDDSVGKILKTLENEGLTEDTFIWFTSDNGPEGDVEDNPNSRYRGSTGGLRGRKSHTHEGGIRVPGIISWPAGLKKMGLKKGTITDIPIIGSDIFPTFLEIAGINLPKDRIIDGTSILPIFKSEDLKRVKPLYWRNGKYEFRVAMREGDWKILANSAMTKFELYNIKEDPNETIEMSKKYPEVYKNLKEQFIQIDQEVLNDGHDCWKKGGWKKNFPSYITE